MTVQNQDTIILTASIEVWAGASYGKGGSRKRIFDSSPENKKIFIFRFLPNSKVFFLQLLKVRHIVQV